MVVAGYMSDICSLKRRSKQASTAKRFPLFPLVDFYKTCIGRHFIIIIFTQYKFSIFTLFAILKKRQINTQFQQATINLPPLPFEKDTKINIFANDR